jgi:hypothetical protein
VIVIVETVAVAFLTMFVWVGIVLIYVLVEMVRRIMTKLDDLKALQERQGKAIANIAADVQELVAKLNTPGGISDADAQALVDQGTAIAERLEAVAAEYTSAGETPATPPTDETPL